ncbi:cellulose biosynthesis protein BcsN [Hoeflea sp.]|uniref:cellulose biosynthesis protein BcsN n=1 Tax=Hoeflea sp. TaxID=1940281 RepID=UPI003747FAAA
MMPRLMAMMALVASVSGCATGDDPDLFTSSIKPQAPTLSADVSPEFAVAYLPQVAGRVEAVRQTSQTDQIFQTILYPNPGYGPGENRLTVSVAPPGTNRSYLQAPTQRQIINEMRAALPDAKMQFTSAAGQNLQGPFGYAIGKAADGANCIFAWQTVREISRTPGTGLGLLGRKSYAAKIRLRYCHPTMGEASLSSLMAGLRVREVTPTTIEMLRFAEGTGVATRPSYAVQEPSVVQARPVSLKPASVATKSAKSSQSVTAAFAAPVRNAPRIVKPRELAGYASAQKGGAPAVKPLVLATAEPAPPAKAISPGKAAAVPLPSDLVR